jgi:hypothetical protein
VVNTELTLRWRDRRSSFRPAGETIRTADYDVAVIASDNEAKRFVVGHHYSGSYPAARWRFGLYRRGELVGVSVFSMPMRAAVLSIFPGQPTDSVELGRFVLVDEVPSNGETWFLARCFEQLRADGVVGVVSFSDPAPRTNAGGAIVFPGHIGTIYQAHNARYLGRGSRKTLRMLPDGRVFSARAIAKIRSGEKGWLYSSRILEAAGAAPLAGDPHAWLAEWLPRVTRPFRHPGNHRYAWILPKRHRDALGEGLPYPKLLEAA